MDAFSFAFSLFVIVLGLALTEVFGGMRTALQARRKIHIGWLLPLLGLVVGLDVISFWTVSWNLRSFMPSHPLALICGFVVTGIYYLVAGMVFPDEPAEWPDYDKYFFEHRRFVAGGVICCNLLMIGFALALGIHIANWFSIISMGVTLGLWTLLIVAPTPAQNIAIMIGQALWNAVSALPAVYPHWFPGWLY